MDSVYQSASRRIVAASLLSRSASTLLASQYFSTSSADKSAWRCASSAESIASSVVVTSGYSAFSSLRASISDMIVSI